MSKRKNDRPPALRFECTQCGECCTQRGKYAHVYVSDAEVAALAELLERSRRSFMRRHTFVDEYGWRQLAFEEKACCFLDSSTGRCRVYAARPVQCRTFPFWREMFGPTDWTAEARRLCEGLGRGRRYSPNEIVAQMQEMDERDDS